MSAYRWTLRGRLRLIWLLVAAGVYVALAVYQLGLPGLHYDEAKEAGVNAMELIRGMPITAFRGATVEMFGVQLPLMVQDYIGALNVYLAAPFLAISGIGVPNLRALPVLIGLVTLFLTERAVSEWIACCEGTFSRTPAPISQGGVIAVTLLAVSPSFVFWSRQGIFVTNLMQPFCMLSVWQGVRWMRTYRATALVWAAAAAGLALYTKLLAVWIIVPFALLMAGWWVHRRLTARHSPSLSLWTVVAAAIALLLPLLPVVLFNAKTGGTFAAVISNAQQSYYGVDNLNLIANLRVRLEQFLQVQRGEQFWYLGGTYSNVIAPWLAVMSVAAGLWRAPRCTWPPLALVASAILISIVTISDLFVTHYALVYPFAVATAAIALDRVWASIRRKTRAARLSQAILVAGLALWFGGNAWVSLQYHQALTRSGGLADHSDATYDLAYYLRYNGFGAPIVLDWGMEAPIRFLSEGAVRPIEIFGYESLDRPDERFVSQLGQFLPNTDNVYLLHSPDHIVFAGRRELFNREAEALGLKPELVETFRQRDGQPLFEVWRTQE